MRWRGPGSRRVVVRSGHEIVELAAGPDVILTDDAIDDPTPAPAVAIGYVEGDFAGRLPLDATAEQIDAALLAVAAGLIVRGPSSKNRNFGPLAEEVWPVLTPREIQVLAALSDGLSNKALGPPPGDLPHGQIPYRIRCSKSSARPHVPKPLRRG